MNTNPLQEITDLLRQYLLQEHSQQKWLFSSPENYEYFKQTAKNKPPSAPQAKTPTVNPPLPSGYAPPLPVQLKPVQKHEKPAEVVIDKSENSVAAPVEVSVYQSPTPPQKQPSATAAASSVSKFKLSPMTLQQTEPLHDIHKIVQEKIPHLVILETPPNDMEAKNIQQAWKNEEIRPQIILLSYEEPPKQAAFLKNLAIALEVNEGSAGIIRVLKVAQTNSWKTLFDPKDLRLVVAAQSMIQSFPEIEKYIGKTPFLLLSDLSLYMKDPKLKSGLWKSLRELLDHSKQV